ncbi:hypothetical protein LNJ03_11265 [Tenacibaculum dicentrarchi]|nr:hypothetical protein [Tenacibaculum dicentrarchi]
MEILFNKDNNGQQEITDVLGFLSDDFEYHRLEVDLELNTPELINSIGENAYLKILEHYKSDEEIDAPLIDIIKKCQLFVGIMGYSDFAGNNDLMHTTAGRKMNNTSDEKTPWDWQIASDNASLKRKAYKTLDQLISALDKIALKEWIESDAYKNSKSLFVYKCSIFNKRYPINNSEQLYFKLVPFMEDVELLEIASRLGDELFKRLKDSIAPKQDFKPLNTLEKGLLVLIEKAIVYNTLAIAYKVFPVEMFAEKINYKESSKVQSTVRAEVAQYLNAEAKKHLLGIELIVEKLSKQDLKSEEKKPINLTSGLDSANKYVDL